jgi:DNA-binding transcriptional LysR family regulator
MINRDLQIDWLKAFVATVDCGSLSGAAEQIHRSQSAVSMQIKKLEAAVGQPVLERDARHIALTPTGTALISYARKILALQSEALERARGEVIRGRLHLGVPEDYAQAYLTPVIRAFSSRHPNVEVALTCEPSGALIQRIENGELDLAMVTRTDQKRGEFLFQEKVYWVASPEYKTWEKHPLPLATHEEGSYIRATVLSMLDNADHPYRIVYQSPSTAGQLIAATSGIAVAVLTQCSVPTELKLLGEKEGFPPLPAMEVELIKNPRAASNSAVDAMYEEIISALHR